MWLKSTARLVWDKSTFVEAEDWDSAFLVEMEKVLGAFKSKATPQEQLREWQRTLRQQSRGIDRQVRGECGPTFDVCSAIML